MWWKINMKNVNKPNHYQLDNGKEVIDIIKESGNHDNFIGYCRGNIIKYIMRYQNKNGIEDLEKAKKYIDFLIEFEKERKDE